MSLAIIDYDTGNIRSVVNALGRLGCEYILTADPETIIGADRIILPGVGEASAAMKHLRERGLDKIISLLTQPVLGICIGLQLMCRHSQEGDTECMGIFDTDVCKFTEAGLKVPHMGWNSIEDLSTLLFNGIAEESYIYYVHSYAPQLCGQTIAATTYGATKFSAAIRNNNFYGTQFHPEKSGGAGERIIKNFLEL